MIIIGGIILFTATIETLKSPNLYIVGIVFLMFGLFNISKTVRSKEDLKDVEINDKEE